MNSLFERLKASCQDDWQAYVTHPFVEQLGAGSLPLDCFKHYLGQDYIFLMHFARAYALAVFKSEHLDDMRQAAGTLDALLNSEMSLHIRFCARWGLDEDALMDLPEAEPNMAYTRMVLERPVGRPARPVGGARTLRRRLWRGGGAADGRARRGPFQQPLPGMGRDLCRR